MDAERFPDESKNEIAGRDTQPEPNLETCTYHPPQPDELGGSDPVAGDRLGDYRFECRVGGGGMGIVYRGWREGTGEAVAIKLLAAQSRRSPALRQALRAEIRALCRVRHDNVVQILDHGELADGSAFLVLEWMEGGSVADLLREQQALSAGAATEFALAACRALRAVHQDRLLHLDVKPANLLLDGHGRLKLADFGLCVEADPGGRAGHAAGIGTPAYFAPEQACDLPVDVRTDLYSLGVSYFEMLTGRRPFEGETVLECAREHVRRHVPCPRTVRRDVPEVCAAIARRAMAKEPGRRFANPAQMLAALEKALAWLRGSNRFVL
jgi:serine/threonine protein kinase